MKAKHIAPGQRVELTLLTATDELWGFTVGMKGTIRHYDARMGNVFVNWDNHPSPRAGERMMSSVQLKRIKCKC